MNYPHLFSGLTDPGWDTDAQPGRFVYAAVISYSDLFSCLTDPGWDTDGQPGPVCLYCGAVKPSQTPGASCHVWVGSSAVPSFLSLSRHICKLLLFSPEKHLQLTYQDSTQITMHVPIFDHYRCFLTVNTMQDFSLYNFHLLRDPPIIDQTHTNEINHIKLYLVNIHLVYQLSCSCWLKWSPLFKGHLSKKGNSPQSLPCLSSAGFTVLD